MAIKQIFRLLFVITILVSCQKNKNTTTGNPFVSLAIASSPANTTVAKNNKTIWGLLIPQSYAYPPPALLLDAVGSNVNISSIWINFSQIEFKYDEVASGSEVDGDSIEFNSIYTVDLLSNAPQPFVSGNISISNMRRVKIKLAKTNALPTGAPLGLLGKSIFISGTVNGHAFTYSTEDETVIEIAGPMLVAAIENRTLLIELQIANLIKRTNLSNITSATNINDTNKVPATNPCATIENGASDLFTCFYKGFEKESNLGRDDDGDFVLDAGESKVKN
jgi:hypothetical protein